MIPQNLRNMFTRVIGTFMRPGSTPKVTRYAFYVIVYTLTNYQ